MLIYEQKGRGFCVTLNGELLADGVLWGSSGIRGQYRDRTVFGADRSLERHVANAIALGMAKLGNDYGEVMVQGELAIRLPPLPPSTLRSTPQ